MFMTTLSVAYHLLLFFQKVCGPEIMAKGKIVYLNLELGSVHSSL
jgi:hypothetical protein